MLNTAKILEAIDAYSATQPEERYEVHIPAEDGKPRKYLGLSALGEECPRKVWYQWRHCAFEDFPPRLYRLFRRGHREELVMINLLRGVGFTVHTHDENGKQFKVTDFEGHLSGHVDGVGEAPKKFWKSGKPSPFLLEFKTYNAKRFAKLVKEGVRKSDPKYHTQVQCYAGYLQLEGCLFMAVCKDDDNLHLEWVPFNQRAFQTAVNKAGDVIGTTRPADIEKIANASLSWYECRFCTFKTICHSKGQSVKSCRSCAHAEPSDGAEWICTAGETYGKPCQKWLDIAHAK